MIPYAIMFLLVGVPVFFLEASLGQFSSSGVLSCWRFAPMFEGKPPTHTLFVYAFALL